MGGKTLRMSLYGTAVGVGLLVGVVSTTSCGQLGQPVDVSSLQAQVSQDKAAVVAIEGQLNAATLPGATQPLTTQQAATVDTLTKDLSKAVSVLNAANAALVAAATQPNAVSQLGAGVQASAPAFGTNAIWVGLIGFVISVFGNIIQSSKGKNTTAALAGVVSGIQSALGSGQMTATPAAAAVVASAITVSHPISDQLVSTLTAAQSAPQTAK